MHRSFDSAPDFSAVNILFTRFAQDDKAHSFD